MAKRIVLVGCGNIGSYHLLSLGGLAERVRVQVVEPSFSAVEIARGRIEGAAMEVEWFSDIGGVDGEADLTIVATLATGRVDVIERLIGMGHRRFLVEKVVSQSVAEYERLMGLMDEYGVEGWVNCTRRYCEFYEEAASVVRAGEGPVVMSVKAGAVGLGCNAVHFLDIFNWLTGEAESLRLDGKHVMGEVFENSRGGELREFAGTITGQTARNDFVSITFLPDGDAEMSVSISSGDLRAAVNELSGKAVMARTDAGWDFCECDFRIPYTSEVTKVIAEEIFSTGACRLPAVEELFVAHRELFEVLGAAMEGVGSRKVEVCPIT